MRIAVAVKQVPETRSVRFDEETGTVVREGVEAIVNPLDLYAIELALQLKEEYGGVTTAVSMGPPKAEIALREAVSMGIDNALLLTDRAFAGSDTWATAYIIAEALQNDSGFDLIICGERATDGDTGQVGPMLAARLDLPVASYVNRFEDIKGGRIRVHRLVEDGSEILELNLPALITVVKEIGTPRLPTLHGKQRAKKLDIRQLDLDALGLDPALSGLKGSPTRVVKTFRPKLARSCELVKARGDADNAAAAGKLCEFLQKRDFI